MVLLFDFRTYLILSTTKPRHYLMVIANFLGTAQLRNVWFLLLLSLLYILTMYCIFTYMIMKLYCLLTELNEVAYSTYPPCTHTLHIKEKEHKQLQECCWRFFYFLYISTPFMRQEVEISPWGFETVL